LIEQPARAALTAQPGRYPASGYGLRVVLVVVVVAVAVAVAQRQAAGATCAARSTGWTLGAFGWMLRRSRGG
jgi:hypothetical protein